MSVLSKKNNFASSATYKTLLNQVRKTLLEGQARIEQERVRTYWETGRIIHADILKNKNRADYGKEVFINLSRDLKVEISTLQRCVQFVKTYPRLPNSGVRRNFSWTHYRKLIAVSDDKKRLRLESEALKSAWSADELALRIKEQKSQSAETSSASAKPSLNNKPLTPLRGTLYTYKLVERPSISGEDSGLLVDLGFGIYHGVDSRLMSGFVKDQIIESKPKDDAYKFVKSDRTAKDLFTYAAYVEKVIDGDTIKVRLDLGFNVWTRQTLRLRGLDCPEVGTKDGDEARTFVRSLLKESQMIVVRSSVSDKYDRYLADVFIPQDQGEDVYLNNLLLESGRAGRMN